MKKPGACYLGLLVGLLSASTPLLAQQDRLPDPAVPDPIVPDRIVADPVAPSPLAAPDSHVPVLVSSDPHVPDPVETVIESCADFDTTGSVYELTGTTTVLGIINCFPRVVVHVKERNAVLRSDKALDTQGLHIVVNREAKLTISVPAISMTRAKGDAKKSALLIVKGRLDFEVTGSTPAFLSASEDDSGSFIKVGPKGEIRSDQAMRFSEDSIIVAKPSSHEGMVDQAGDPISVTQELLEESPPTTSASDETGPSAATSSTDSSQTTEDDAAAPVDSGGHETGSGVPPSSTIPTEEDRPSSDTEPDTNRAVTGSGVHPSSTIPAEEDRPPSDTEPNTNPPADTGSGAPPSSTIPTEEDRPPSDTEPDSNPPADTGSGVSPSSTIPREEDRPPTDTEPDTNPPADKHAPTTENAPSSPIVVDVNAVISRAKANRSKNAEIFKQFDKLFQKSHPEASLRVGQRLAGRLRSLDWTTAIYPGHVDGSIRLERATGPAPVDATGRPTGPVPKEVTTLAKAKFEMVRRVYQLRQDITGEEEQARKSKKLAPLLKWLPFGEHGFLEENARRRARENLKEVYIAVTDRGRVEVSMDGIVVLRVSGPSFLGYRARDPTYELRTTSRGLEVRRKGKLDWSLDADFA